MPVDFYELCIMYFCVVVRKDMHNSKTVIVKLQKNHTQRVAHEDIV